MIDNIPSLSSHIKNSWATSRRDFTRERSKELFLKYFLLIFSLFSKSFAFSRRRCLRCHPLLKKTSLSWVFEFELIAHNFFGSCASHLTTKREKNRKKFHNNLQQHLDYSQQLLLPFVVADVKRRVSRSVLSIYRGGSSR